LSSKSTLSPLANYTSTLKIQIVTIRISSTYGYWIRAHQFERFILKIN